MPEWIHERAKHILAKNPSMPESMAFGIATQQSHALGKSPKGYGTSEGRHNAKQKFRKPKQMEHTANPGELETPKLSQVLAKFAFVEALPAITGIASGYAPGREVAGQVGEEIAPKGLKQQGAQWGRNAAMIGVPLGGLAAMALAHRFGVAPRMADFAKRRFEKGLIADPGAEQELINLGVPGVAAIGGSLLGGGLSGAVAGGLQHLRSPPQHHAKTAALKPSPMWSRIGGASSKRPVWMAQSGFTPTGFKTPAQRLSKSMDMGTFDSSKGLHPLDLGKMQQSVQQSAESMKMGMVMLAITKTATGQKIPVKNEREDAETGDEADPIFDKESADNSGQEGFSTNQYSGVMNPPTLPYRSGMPPWQEPPVKTMTPQAQPDYTKEGGLLGEAEELAAQEHGKPSKIRIPSSVAGLADDAFVLSRRFTGKGDEEKTAAGMTPAGRLNSASAIGAPKVTSAPGPSISQIAKPKGFGMPMSGAKKGNHII